MSVTVKDALNLPSYRDCYLIAGKEGIHNIILYTDSMEVPDIKPWLRANLFMITTGYSLSHSPGGLKQLILDLHNAGSAGLAIKTKFTGEISEDILAAADQLKLPLIQVPDDAPTSALFMPLLNLIYNEQDIQLQSNYFFIDLMNGTISTEAEAKLRVQPMKWPKPPLQLILFHIKNNQQSYSYNEEILKKSFQNLSAELEKYILLPNNDNMILIIPGGYKDSFLQAGCENICTYIRSQFGLSVCAGISDPVLQYIDLYRAFSDALDAVRTGLVEHPDKLCFFIRDLRLEQALLDLKGNQKLKSCFEETFSVLKNYDIRHSGSLMETLKALTKAGGSKAQAAEKLFLHRNTLIYRIKKIEELTGMDLTDHDTISRLSFLFRIEPYL